MTNKGVITLDGMKRNLGVLIPLTFRFVYVHVLDYRLVYESIGTALFVLNLDKVLACFSSRFDAFLLVPVTAKNYYQSLKTG